MTLARLAATTYFWLVVLLCSAVGEARGEETAAEEYQVKAAFLYNFARFVEWPAEAFGSAPRITICVIASSGMAGMVRKAVAGKQIGERGLTVQELTGVPAAGTCHILFVGKGETKRQAAILREVQDPYLLTVGESEDFLAAGGVINLKLKEATVRIEINAAAVARLKCRISAKLLSLAEGGRP